ncbi:MAG: hypothetical protein Q8R30_03205 [bacterium]|nr:hypothetical protein [bacterium]MDZ4285769.1 hypothetical protein [Candidatus Sungbacteria bacterium]
MPRELLLSFLSEFGLDEQGFVPIGQRFYCQVYRMSAMQRVIKIITSHRVLQPEGFHTKSEAIGFAKDIVTYMEKLAGLGVSVSPIEETNLFVLGAKNTGETFIVISVPDGGKSVEMFLEAVCSPHSLHNLALSMIKTILPVLQQTRIPSQGYSEVGMDAVPSNFALNNGRMTYIDFTPPRYYSPDHGFRVEYPQPTLEAEMREARWRYYEPSGILTRWLTDCCRIRPDGRNQFISALRESVDGALWRFMEKHLRSLTLPADFKAPEWQIAVESVHQPIDIRDIACAMAHTDTYDASSKQWLSEIFIASRHHPGEPIPKDKLDALRNMLLDRLSTMVSTA